MSRSLAVALVSEVFHGARSAERLHARLSEARQAGAELAVLPELPLDPWIAVERRPRDADAEDPNGPRARLFEAAAQKVGIAVLGGAIVRDPTTGSRFSHALLMDRLGRRLGEYRKLHLPEEEGYWETAHYEPGDRAPEVVPVDGFPVGIQLCSDVNRPQGTQLLAAAGAAVLLSPRATPPESYPRWRLVLRSLAATGAMYVVSVNRPAEVGTPNGGPSLAIGPDGEVLVETAEPLTVLTLDSEVVDRARRTYPGYLPFRPEIFSEAWKRLEGKA